MVLTTVGRKSILLGFIIQAIERPDMSGDQALLSDAGCQVEAPADAALDAFIQQAVREYQDIVAPKWRYDDMASFTGKNVVLRVLASPLESGNQTTIPKAEMLEGPEDLNKLVRWWREDGPDAGSIPDQVPEQVPLLAKQGTVFTLLARCITDFLI